MSQCNARELRAAFPGGKRAAIVRLYPDIFFLCACSVFVFPYHRLWGLLFKLRQIGMGYLTCVHIWVRAVHSDQKGGGGEGGGVRHKTSLHKSERLSFTLPRQGWVEPSVFGFDFPLSNNNNNNNGVYLYCACTIITRAPSTLQWQQLIRNRGDKNKCTQIER